MRLALLLFLFAVSCPLTFGQSDNPGALAHAFPVGSTVTHENARLRFTLDRDTTGLVRLRSLEDKTTSAVFDLTSIEPILNIRLGKVGEADVASCQTQAPDCVGEPFWTVWSDDQFAILQITWPQCRPQDPAWNPLDSLDVLLEIKLPTVAGEEDLAELRVGVDVHSTAWDVTRTVINYHVHQQTPDAELLHPSFNGMIIRNPANQIDSSSPPLARGQYHKMFSSIRAFWEPAHDQEGLYLATHDETGTHPEEFFVDADNSQDVLIWRTGHHGHTFGDFGTGPFKKHRAAYPFAFGVFQGGEWGVVKRHRQWLLQTPMIPARLDAGGIPSEWIERPIFYVLSVPTLGLGVNLANDYSALHEVFCPTSELGSRRPALFQWAWTLPNWAPATQIWDDNYTGLLDSFAYYEPRAGAKRFFETLDSHGFDCGAYTLSHGISLNGPLGPNAVKPWAARAQDGSYYTTEGDLGRPERYIAKPWEPGFQANYTQIGQARALDLGMKFLYFDQPYNAVGDLGKHGSEVFQGYLDTMTGVRSAMQTVDPSCFAVFEGFHPVFSPLRMSQTYGADEYPPDAWTFANTEYRRFPLLEALLHEHVTFTNATIQKFPTTPPAFYQPFGDSSLTYDQQLKKWGDLLCVSQAGSFRWGHIPSHGEQADSASGMIDQLFPFAPLAQVKLDEYVDFVRLLVKARLSDARKFLIFGQLIEPVQLSGEGTDEREFIIRDINDSYGGAFGAPYDVTYPKILDSTWRGTDGSLGLMFINYSDDPVSVNWQINPADYDPPLPGLIVRQLDSPGSSATVEAIRFDNFPIIDPTQLNQVTVQPRSLVMYEIR